jgi:hypothetical protein
MTKMNEPLLVLIGVASRYLVGEGLVQEAVFMNQVTGEEYVLGLVSGQFEALLEILRLNNGESTSGQNSQDAVEEESAARSTAAIRIDRKLGSNSVPLQQEDEEDTEPSWTSEEDTEEDVVDEATPEAIRSIFGRGF